MGRRRNMEFKDLFTFTPPTEEQQARMDKIREAGRKLAQTIADNAVQCADRGLAIAWVRNAVFSGNAAVIGGDKEATDPTKVDAPEGFPEEEAASSPSGEPSADDDPWTTPDAVLPEEETDKADVK